MRPSAFCRYCPLFFPTHAAHRIQLKQTKRKVTVLCRRWHTDYRQMPPRGNQGYRQRSAANRSETTVFKYGSSEVTGDNDNDILVYYWSAPDKNVHNASGDLEQERLTGVTVVQQQQQQLQQRATSSITGSSVHSAAVVLTIAGTRQQFQCVLLFLKSLRHQWQTADKNMVILWF